MLESGHWAKDGLIEQVHGEVFAELHQTIRYENPEAARNDHGF